MDLEPKTMCGQCSYVEMCMLESLNFEFSLIKTIHIFRHGIYHEQILVARAVQKREYTQPCEGVNPIKRHT